MHARDEGCCHDRHNEHGDRADDDERRGFPTWLRGGLDVRRCYEEGCAYEEEDWAELYEADKGGFESAAVVDEETFWVD